MARILTLVLMIAFTPACVVTSGRLESNRFQHAVYPYALFYGPTGRAEAPLGPHYKLVNFRSPDGKHRYQKAGDGYVVERRYADESPAVAQREPFYDLLLARDEPPAALWVRSVPLRPADTHQTLRQIAQRYLDTVAKLGKVAVPFGVEQAAQASAPAQLRNVRTSECELSKRRAVRLDFEVENPGATKTLNEPEWKAGSVVLVQSGYFARREYPVVIVAGRSSSVEDAAQLEPDFERMLERLVLGDKGQGLSMKGGHTCRAEGVSTPVEPSQASGPSEGDAAPRNTSDQLEVPLIQERAMPESGGGELPMAPETTP